MKTYKGFSLYFLMVFILLLVQQTCYGDSINDVEIEIEPNTIHYYKNIESIVKVKFNNELLFNDNVKMSYHLLGKNSEVLKFENVRYSFNLINGEAKIPLVVDIDQIAEVQDEDYVEIVIDLVDEQNLYWFNDNRGITMSEHIIVYENSIFGRFRSILIQSVNEQPIQLVMNLLYICGLVYMYLIIAKRYNSENI